MDIGLNEDSETIKTRFNAVVKYLNNKKCQQPTTKVVGLHFNLSEEQSAIGKLTVAL